MGHLLCPQFNLATCGFEFNSHDILLTLADLGILLKTFILIDPLIRYV
jgi:hypothetical protein